MSVNKRGRRGVVHLQRQRSWKGVCFTLPFLFGFFVFFVLPFGLCVSLSFTFGAGGNHFVGLKNYRNVLEGKAFQLAVYNTFRFIVVGVPLIMAISFGLALLLKKAFLGASFFRTVFLLPMVVPVASTVMVFDIFFADQGILNHCLGLLGLSGRSFLDSGIAFWILIVLYVWKNCGYNMILFLTALSAIPEDFYEAARMDGANRWNCFRSITVPLMIPSLFMVFLISVLNSFKSFREAYLIGGTMPHSSIYMLQHFMNHNFANLNYQRLSVAALLIFWVIWTLVYVLYKVERKAGDVQL